jgi:inhibitor of cysteine peptidase
MHLNIDPTHFQLGRRLGLLTLFAGCVLAVMSLCSVAARTMAETPPAITVTEQESGKTIDVMIGAKILVQLSSNPTTGYQWSVLGSPAPLELVKSTYATDPQAAGRVGAGGTQTLRFAAKSAGRSELKLGYARPWEKDVPPAKTFSVTVVIK